MGYLQKKIVKGYQRIRSNGDYGCNGGVYNPSVIPHRGGFLVVYRAEKDYGFTDEGCGYVVELVDKYKFEDSKPGMWAPAGKRIEDIRVYGDDGVCYNAFATVCDDDGIRVESVFFDENSIKYTYPIGLVGKSVEKNWAFVGQHLIIYSLDPLVVFGTSKFGAQILVDLDNGWSHAFGSFLSISCHPIRLNQDLFLGFYHIVENGQYKHGAYLFLAGEKRITHRTGILFGSEFCGADVHRRNCIYVSSAVLRDEDVLLFCGEGDSHSGVITLDLPALLGELRENPMVQEKYLKVRFDDNGIGDFICMMYAMQSYCDANPEVNVKLYLKNGGLLGLAALFSIRNLSFYHEAASKRFSYDIILNGNGRECVYKQKVKGSFKEWYAKKMDCAVSVPVLKKEYNTPYPGLENFIVIAPFAAHSNRSWPMVRWKELVTRLIAAGETVVVVDGSPDKIKGLPGKHMAGLAFDSLFWLIGASKQVICNESGIAHIAGLLGKETLVLSGWLDPALVYDYTTVKWILGNGLHEISVDAVFKSSAGQ